MAKKTGVFSRIYQDILHRFLRRGDEIALSTDDRTVPCFPICRGTLKYHCLNVCINSGDDMAILYNNLMDLCQVTPEIMELI